MEAVSVEDLKMNIFALQLENRNLKHYRGKFEAIRIVKDRKATKEQLQKTVVELRCELKAMEVKVKEAETKATLTETHSVATSSLIP